jgi:hypothetical protein
MEGLMHIRLLIALATAAVIVHGGFLAERSPVYAGDKIDWNKSVNFNTSKAAPRKNKPRDVSRKKQTSRHEVAIVPELEQEPVLPPVEISAPASAHPLWTGSLSEPVLPKSAPERCEWARSIVAGYAFGNVEATNCRGSVYRFEATRDEKRFSIEVSAVNGQLTKVEKLQATSATAHDNATFTVEPAAK